MPYAGRMLVFLVMQDKGMDTPIDTPRNKTRSPCALSFVLLVFVLVFSVGALAGSDTVAVFSSAGDRFLFRNSNSVGPAEFRLRLLSAAPGAIPIAGRWRGGSSDSIGLFDPGSNRFQLFADTRSALPDLDFRLQLPGTGYKPLAGDWNGNGTDTVGAYHPATGMFYLRNRNTTGSADLTIRFGPAGKGWLPVTGDWDGDGVDTIGLYNPAAARFYLARQNVVKPARRSLVFGPVNRNWIPLSGDWQGYGRDQIGLYDQQTGRFHLAGPPGQLRKKLSFRFGAGGNLPVMGDWDGSRGDGVFVQGADGLLVAEAESFQAATVRNGHYWQRVAAAGSSGSGAVQALPVDSVAYDSDFVGNSPRLDYVGRFEQTGLHYVWVRARSLGSGSNSLHFGIDGKNPETSSSMGPFSPAGTWRWLGGTDTPVMIDEAGLHTLNLWMKESGLIVDKLVVTADPAFVPGQPGPAESLHADPLPIVDGFDGGRLPGWVDVDQTQRTGIWWHGERELLQLTELSTGADSMAGSYNIGVYTYLMSTMGLRDYRFSVDVASSSDKGQDIGVMFRYQDENNFYRFSLSSERGFGRLERVAGGRFVTLAENPRGYRSSNPFRIAIEVRGKGIQVFVNERYPDFPNEGWEAVFSAIDGSFGRGGIALYARGVARFDNLRVQHNSLRPSVAISKPEAYTVLGSGPRNVAVTAVTMNLPNRKAYGVRFEIDGALCGASRWIGNGAYKAVCQGVLPGDHSFDAIATRNGTEIARDRSARVGVTSGNLGSYRYLALGDSITNGVGDTYASDNQGPDSRVITFRGYPSQLGELLSKDTAGPSLVVNEGFPGDTIEDFLGQRLEGVMERNPVADHTLLMLGTNNAQPCGARAPNGRCIPLPSGAGCPYVSRGDCSGTFKGGMLDLLGEIDYPSIYMPLLPPGFGDWKNGMYTGQVSDGVRNVAVRAYNYVIAQELTVDPRVKLGPDLYSCYLGTRNRFSLFKDYLHPNGLGYAVMAALWGRVLSGSPVVPGGACKSPIYILEDLRPYTYKQNLMEVGDEVYRDADNELVKIPNLLREGRWIIPAHADRKRSDKSFVTFNAGPKPVNVYLAVDPQGEPPFSASHQFRPYTGAGIRVDGGNVRRFNLYRAINVTGKVSLGGNLSGGPGARAHYLVIVTPP